MYSMLVSFLPLGDELLSMDRFLPASINLVISNIPGPRQKMYFRGALAVGIYPVNTLTPAVALSMTVCSYGGKLFFGLVGGRSAIPDLNSLTGYLHQAFDEIRALENA